MKQRPPHHFVAHWCLLLQSASEQAGDSFKNVIGFLDSTGTCVIIKIFYSLVHEK